MSNMSYCRFQNTNSDLVDCSNTIVEMIDGEAEPVEDRERDAAKCLFGNAIEIIQKLIEVSGADWDELDQNPRKAIDKFFETLDTQHAEANGGEEDDGE